MIQKLDNVCVRISKDSLQQLNKYADYNKLKAKQLALTYKVTSIPDSDLYNKNKLQKELIETRLKLKNFELKNYSIDVVLQDERESLLAQLKQQKPLLFSGYISYFLFADSNK